MDENYNFFVKNIKQTDKYSFEKAKMHLNNLVKPLGSFGKLEEIASRLCSISSNQSPNIKKRCIIILAADNGVVVEGVSSAPQEITAIQTLNIINKVTGVGVLAKQFDAELIVADVGINADIAHEFLINKKIRKSTGNITYEQAMSRHEAEHLILVGIQLAQMAKNRGYNLIGVGEMGIGNTTTSSAVLAAILGLDNNNVSEVVGRGAGLDDFGYKNKIKIIQNSLEFHKPNKNDPIDIIHKVGGLDIAAMTGVYIGAAYYGLPIVVDGFISIVAALCAVRLNFLIKEYLFFSHNSYELGYKAAAKELDIKPCLDLDMHLGEGSGCPIMFGVMDSAISIFKNMATFNDANIDTKFLEKINIGK